MPSPFWSGFRRSSSGEATSPDDIGAPRSIQEGLLQIGSQACHILVHRIDSAAAEALHRHHRPPRALSRPRASPRTSHYPRGQGGVTSADPEQYVVLLSDQGLPHGPPLPSLGRPSASTVVALSPTGSTSFKKPPLATDRKSSHSILSTKKLSSAPDEDVDQWGSHFLVRSEDDISLPHHTHHSRWSSKGWCRPAYIPISLILILIVLVVLLPLLEQTDNLNDKLKLGNGSLFCGETCRISLVESIPEGLTYPPTAPKFPSTYEIWDQLINISQSSIEIASLYWSLRGADIYPHPSARQGEDIFNKLIDASVERDIKLRIAQNAPSKDMPGTDTEELERKAFAEVRSLNFPKLLGSGVLHTKFWIVDRKHVYIGSANMDWRSLTQVKEMGAVIYDCPCIANDILKIFNVYWDLGKKDAVIPPKWPDSYITTYNMATPMSIPLNEIQSNTFLSSSPPPFCPSGRSGDADTIVDLISKAEKFVYIAVMDYIPLTIYSPKPKYWPVINDALLAAAINNRVNVRVLASSWNHTRKAEIRFLRSLEEVSDSYKYVKIEVKLFRVPATPDQQKIPFARVNHNKYMVTDNAAYIGTSNWSGDYFIDTAGVGLVVKPTISNRRQNSLPIRDQLQAVFERDWNSPYAQHLSDVISSANFTRFLE